MRQLASGIFGAVVATGFLATVLVRSENLTERHYEQCQPGPGEFCMSHGVGTFKIPSNE